MVEREKTPPGLSRLPPGRHGLSRDFVEENQRDRLTAGMIAAVAEYGFADTTISRIVEAAGLSRRTFYVYYDSKEASYLAVATEIVDHLRSAADDATATTAEWPEKVRARLGAVLEGLAANPDLATFLLVEPLRAGGDLAELYKAGAAKALADLTEGMPEELDPPTGAVETALVGGIASIVARRVEDGHGDALVDLLPELTTLTLAPYLGLEAA